MLQMFLEKPEVAWHVVKGYFSQGPATLKHTIKKKY